MEDLTVSAHDHDFGPMHVAMQRYVDRQMLAGVSSAVLVGRDLVDLNCIGWADRERGIPLRTDHLFRIFSNTKLIASCAALLLFEDGEFDLDEPIDRFIPQLSNRRVLRAGAASIDDTEPARGPITIRQLLSHSAGLSHGLFDFGSPLFGAYQQHNVRNPMATLAQMMDTLAPLPLAFQPGTSWEYSVATDVIARLVELVSGQPFDAFLRVRILDPLGMADTGFVIPTDQQHRLATCYAGADPLDPMVPGLTPTADFPYPDAYLRAFPWLSGGGGMVSSLPDMVALLRSLLPGGKTLLKAETIHAMMTNQLAEGVSIRFPGFGDIKGKGFGLAGAVTVRPAAHEPAEAEDEFQWGGIAGTHWWISPRANLAGVLMTQRQMAFWHPFSFEFKQAAYRAASKAGV